MVSNEGLKPELDTKEGNSQPLSHIPTLELPDPQWTWGGSIPGRLDVHNIHIPTQAILVSRWFMNSKGNILSHFQT